MKMEQDKQKIFRDAMSNLAAAVNIVTTGGKAGLGGITATAVCSVSDSPATMLVCVNQQSGSHDKFRENENVCINICSQEQEPMSYHFAGMTKLTMDERFQLPDWTLSEIGVPKLDGAIANLEGRIKSVNEVGTHSVFYVEIEDININSSKDALIYFNREFRTVKNAQATAA
ncbi:MFS transporter [Vibrio nigripulchritudo]|nr:MFS transporter [Vibrio nigripulchritudo]